MKSKPKKKSLAAKLKGAKKARRDAKDRLESSRGSAKLQIIGAKMKLKEVKKREKQSRLPGPSAEMGQAELHLKKTKERAAGKDSDGLRLRKTIKDNRPIAVIKRHFKGE